MQWLHDMTYVTYEAYMIPRQSPVSIITNYLDSRTAWSKVTCGIKKQIAG